VTGSDPPDSSVETRLRVSRIIHAAMVVSLVVYAVVVHMLRAVVEWKPVAEPAVVETVRWLLAPGGPEVIVVSGGVLSGGAVVVAFQLTVMLVQVPDPVGLLVENVPAAVCLAVKEPVSTTSVGDEEAGSENELFVIGRPEVYVI